jgi:hypothetical protein
MNVVDMGHAVMFLGCIAAYAVMNIMGHSDPTNNQALLGLASFTAGSYVRSKT